jgi:signal recognition particle receptor subunit beta
MVQINFAQRQVNAKIVYYGPACPGRRRTSRSCTSARLKAIAATSPASRTDGDRTLFFDFMPLDLGTVAGMRTCFQIYTVPGQVYYNSTRKLVLQGVDGVVFVADSSAAMVEQNLESLRNLEENLREYGKSLATMPHIIQYNKRDLPDALPVDELNRLMNPHNAPFFEAIANTGQGVFPTLKALAARVLESIHQSSNQGGAPAPRPAAPRAPQAPAPQMAPAAMPAPVQAAPRIQLRPENNPMPQGQPMQVAAHGGGFQGGQVDPMARTQVMQQQQPMMQQPMQQQYAQPQPMQPMPQQFAQPMPPMQQQYAQPQPMQPMQMPGMQQAAPHQTGFHPQNDAQGNLQLASRQSTFGHQPNAMQGFAQPASPMPQQPSSPPAGSIMARRGRSGHGREAHLGAAAQAGAQHEQPAGRHALPSADAAPRAAADPRRQEGGQELRLGVRRTRRGRRRSGHVALPVVLLGLTGGNP